MFLWTNQNQDKYDYKIDIYNIIKYNTFLINVKIYYNIIFVLGVLIYDVPLWEIHI